ncbi:MAG: hypothetical protein NTX65_06175 [Ignavibacteriales bacterium]|nr:hypothetical protein [Ignavibacteriales bacterium]
MKIKPIFFFLLFIVKIASAQIESLSIGGSLHLGSISGNSPSVSSIGATFFIDFYPWFEHDVSFRSSFTYSQIVEKFLPENRTGKYYPFIKFFSLKGFIRQDFAFPFYIEEGAGFIYLNDRTFSDVNLWEAGIGFNALVGFDFRKINSNGFSLGLGIDYGITFTHTTANYFLVYLQSQYYF